MPPGVYGGPGIGALFTNRLDPAAHPFYSEVSHLRVSAHFVIRRDGALMQFVDVDRRAWHAGVSSWQGHPGCNDFSVGVELEGLEGEPFEAPQYASLLRLLSDLRGRYPITTLAGHEHVAPGRKKDPGDGFEGRRVTEAAGLDGPW